MMALQQTTTVLYGSDKDTVASLPRRLLQTEAAIVESDPLDRQGNLPLFTNRLTMFHPLISKTADPVMNMHRPNR